MKNLVLKVHPIAEQMMSTLEERGLVQRFRTPAMDVAVPEGTTKVERLYATDPAFGSHQLISVHFNKSVVDLGTHPDHEDFILINTGRLQKPLILVIGLHPRPEFQVRVSRGELTTDDIWAIEMKFNDPHLSFFTLKGDTPHCEWTIPGAKPASLFFVTEPSRLPLHRVDMGDYALKVVY